MAKQPLLPAFLSKDVDFYKIMVFLAPCQAIPLPKIRSQIIVMEGAAITINNGSSGYLYLIEAKVIICIMVRYTTNPRIGVKYLNISRLVIKVAKAKKIIGNKDMVVIKAIELCFTNGVYGDNLQNRKNFTRAISKNLFGS